MAILILGQTKCSICDEVIHTGQSIVASPHFIEDPSHPLWRFSDSTMHYGCFQSWTHRGTFVDEYNHTFGSIVWGNGNRHTMQDDGTIVTIKVRNAKTQ